MTKENLHTLHETNDSKTKFSLVLVYQNEFNINPNKLTIWGINNPYINMKPSQSSTNKRSFSYHLISISHFTLLV